MCHFATGIWLCCNYRVPMPPIRCDRYRRALTLMDEEPCMRHELAARPCPETPRNSRRMFYTPNYLNICPACGSRRKPFRL